MLSFLFFFRRTAVDKLGFYIIELKSRDSCESNSIKIYHATINSNLLNRPNCERSAFCVEE